jgi:hypothetical protein
MEKDRAAPDTRNVDRSSSRRRIPFNGALAGGCRNEAVVIGAAARIRTWDLILANRLDSISGHARSAAEKPPGALYFKDPGGFFARFRKTCRKDPEGKEQRFSC